MYDLCWFEHAVNLSDVAELGSLGGIKKEEEDEEEEYGLDHAHFRFKYVHRYKLILPHNSLCTVTYCVFLSSVYSVVVLSRF